MAFEREQPRQPEPVGIFHRGLGGTEPVRVCISCKIRDSDYDPGPDEFSDESNDAIRALLDYIGKPPSNRALIELLKLSERVLRILRGTQSTSAGVGWAVALGKFGSENRKSNTWLSATTQIVIAVVADWRGAGRRRDCSRY